MKIPGTLTPDLVLELLRLRLKAARCRLGHPIVKNYEYAFGARIGRCCGCGLKRVTSLERLSRARLKALRREEFEAILASYTKRQERRRDDDDRNEIVSLGLPPRPGRVARAVLVALTPLQATLDPNADAFQVPRPLHPTTCSLFREGPTIEVSRRTAREQAEERAMAMMAGKTLTVPYEERLLPVPPVPEVDGSGVRTGGEGGPMPEGLEDDEE